MEKLEALLGGEAAAGSPSMRQRLFEAAYASHNRLQRARDMFETRIGARASRFAAPRRDAGHRDRPPA